MLSFAVTPTAAKTCLIDTDPTDRENIMNVIVIKITTTIDVTTTDILGGKAVTNGNLKDGVLNYVKTNACDQLVFAGHGANGKIGIHGNTLKVDDIVKVLDGADKPVTLFFMTCKCATKFIRDKVTMGLCEDTFVHPIQIPKESGVGFIHGWVAHTDSANIGHISKFYTDDFPDAAGKSAKLAFGEISTKILAKLDGKQYRFFFFKKMPDSSTVLQRVDFNFPEEDKKGEFLELHSNVLSPLIL